MNTPPSKNITEVDAAAELIKNAAAAARLTRVDAAHLAADFVKDVAKDAAAVLTEESDEARRTTAEAEQIAADLVIEVAKAAAATIALTAAVAKSIEGNNPAEMYRLMGRVESKIDTIVLSIETHLLDDKTLFKAQDNRIGSLERSRAWVFGAAAVVGGAGALLFSLATKLG